MSKSIKLFAMLGLFAVVAACDTNPGEVFIIVDPAPISVEPVFTSKYE
jgi:hypothetical protein